MSTVWRFTYNAGAGNVNVDFSHLEAARNVMRQNCAVDVQRYKNRLARIYVGPSIWSSINLGIINLGTDTVAKFDQLKAVRVPMIFAYHYNVNAAINKKVSIIPTTEKMFQAGGLSTRDLTLSLVETSTAINRYYKMTRGSDVRYLCLNSTYNGYTIVSSPPNGYVEQESVQCFQMDAATDVFVFLNSTLNGLAFATAKPGWVTDTLIARSTFILERSSEIRYAKANATFTGISIYEA